MPISIWQRIGLYDIQIGYYFVRKVHSISDRLAERVVKAERLKVKGYWALHRLPHPRAYHTRMPGFPLILHRH